MSPRLDRPFVLVGGGIAGLTVARELACRGRRVTVVERGRIGSREDEGAATPASVGVLTSPRSGTSLLRRCQLLAFRKYPDLEAQLRAETACDVGLRVRGALHLAAEMPRDAARARRLRVYLDARVECRWVERTELEDLFPGLPDRFSSALYLPGEAVVDPVALIRALQQSCRRSGVHIHEGAGEARVVLEGPAAVRFPDGSILDGHEIIVAAGAWSGRVLGMEETSPRGVRPVGPAADDGDAPSLPAPQRGEEGMRGLGFPMRPIRGQVIEVRLPRGEGPNLRFRPPGREKDYHLISRGKDRFWVGSTVEDAGFSAQATAEGIDELLGAGRDVVPGLGPQDVVDRWAGLRPQALLRGGPRVGPLPAAPGVWLHCGHYRSGVLLAPLTARLLVHRILDDEDSLRREGVDPAQMREFGFER
jgi:glycine oxidase